MQVVNMHMAASGNVTSGCPYGIAVFHNGFAHGNIAQGSLMTGWHVGCERKLRTFYHYSLSCMQRHEGDSHSISRIDL